MHRLYCLYSTVESPDRRSSSTAHVITSDEQAAAFTTPGRFLSTLSEAESQHTDHHEDKSYTTPGRFLHNLGGRAPEDPMERSFESASQQMPVLLGQYSSNSIAVGDIELAEPGRDASKLIGDVAVFRLPYGGLVICVTIDFDGNLEKAVTILRTTLFNRESVLLDGRGILAVAASIPSAASAVSAVRFEGDVHHVLVVDPAQIDIFCPQAGPDEVASSGLDECPGDVDRSVVQRLAIRSYDALRSQFDGIRFPTATNRDPGTLVATGAAVTVISGIREEVTGWLLWSAIQLTASLARLRQIRREAYSTLSEMERGVQAERQRERDGNYVAVRRHLSELSRRLGRLELELGFGVEAYVDVQFVLPSPMLAHYHRSAVSAMGISEGVATTADLMDRATRAVAARREVVRSAERAADEARIQRATVAAAVLSIVGLVAGVFFGFFGSDAAPVEANRPSYFDGVYLTFYIVLVAFLFSILALLLLIKRLYRARLDTQELATWGVVQRP